MKRDETTRNWNTKHIESLGGKKSLTEIQSFRRQARPQGCFREISFSIRAIEILDRDPRCLRNERQQALHRKSVTTRYFDRSHSRGSFLLTIDFNQRRPGRFVGNDGRRRGGERDLY